jgi:tetratricopeptide (TPR) repeat protein
MFKPETILAGLNKRLQLLVNGADKITSRQQTLRGAIDWSFNLLEDNEKLLFARLSIFGGGFTPDAIEKVCNPDFDPDFDTLDGLTSLLDQSLVRLINSPGEDEPRFKILETIREFAQEKLVERNEKAEISGHYSAYFLELAGEAEPELTGPQQAAWFNRLDQEYANFREVIEQELINEKNSPLVTLQITGALWRFWVARGYIPESREWLEAGLISGISDPPAEPNRTGWQCLSAKAYNAAGLLALEEGDLNRAKAMAEEGLKLEHQLEDPAGLANILNSLGTIEAYLGNFNEALNYHQECLKVRRELNDTRGIAISLCNLGALASAQAALEQSRLYYEEALSLLRRVGDKRTMALLLNNLGNLWLVQGDALKAKILTEESRAVYQELGDRGGMALALMQMADIARTQSQPTEAVELYRQSLNLFEEVGEKADLPPCIEGLAGTFSDLGKFRQAAVLFGAAQALREAISCPLQPADMPHYSQEIAKIKHQLNEATFSEEWSEGYKLDLEQTFMVVK